MFVLLSNRIHDLGGLHAILFFLFLFSLRKRDKEIAQAHNNSTYEIGVLCKSSSGVPSINSTRRLS